ncbi:SRPBCC domain-containing protein [Sporosarcina sp. ANT_H38]|uniref:SRPBCC family protein n=1 Tax=Sporosarcina sp. ANT_H38 TaxID=2597358 RepID=UPI0011F3975D|nr:SRPBCC domain-containing protein [Sporosarcina sp. ANT_H38]KAA0967013.1 SRPBCC domain-containing protein [Sporosarcina sp. ANT_H38]
MKSDVSLDLQFESSIEQVWNALTNSDTLVKWVWDNDFKPVVGHEFQFRAKPSEWWDGIVDGKVLEVDEPHILSYTWVSAGESTTVTWTLKKGSDGTIHLHLDQTGFSEETRTREGALEGAKYAWMNIGDQLEKVLAEL